MKLFVVESPHKAKTIGSFLNKGNVKEWSIVATKGHIRDLPTKEYGVEKIGTEYHGKEIYISNEKKEIIEKIAELASKATDVFIATDNDREGEKIADDIVRFAKIKKYKRIVYSEITESAIREAIDNAREVDARVVDAQKARRIIDRLGYKLSQIITYSLRLERHKCVPSDETIGIGRVSVAALKLIVENTRVRRQFVPEEKINISVKYETPEGEQFGVVYPRQFLKTEKVELEDTMRMLKDAPHIVAKFEKKRSDKLPRPPLTTAYLQREAFYSFGFYPEETMSLAQNLYDSGFITYHRTEGMDIAKIAVESILETLSKHFTEDDIEYKGRSFSKKDGLPHEAIRPCAFEENFYPKHIRNHEKFYEFKLNEKHAKLYTLIWYRTLMTQMKEAKYDKPAIDINCSTMKLRGVGNYVALDENKEEMLGWKKLQKFIGGREDPDEADEIKYLPSVEIGAQLEVIDVESFIKKTKTPDRYGIGRFVTVLQEKGIGRPSTFHTVPKSLLEKHVVKDVGGYLESTELGEIIIEWCEKHDSANWLVDLNHCAEFEAKLSEIETGETEDYHRLIEEYSQQVDELKVSVGYKDKDELSPTPAMCNMLKHIEKTKQLKLPEDAYTNYEKAQKIISAHTKDIVTIGKCPSCKKADVVMREGSDQETGETYIAYRCTSKECGFKIYDKAMERFFNYFRKESDPESRKIILKGVLKNGNKGYKADGFHNDAGEPQEKTISLHKDPDYGWKLNFAQKKKT